LSFVLNYIIFNGACYFFNNIFYLSFVLNYIIFNGACYFFNNIFYFRRKCFAAVRPNIPPINRAKIPRKGMAAILIFPKATIKKIDI